QRGRVDLVVASGDVYCLAMARLAGAPTVLVAGPKSEHMAPHSALEIWLIRRMASQVFARDEATAAALRRRGVRAEFVGTWMIDSLEFSGETFGIPGDRPVITVLPGSKSPAIDNLLPLLRAATGAVARAKPVPAVLATATWEDAAGALARLLADPDERQRRGEAGRERQGQGGGADAIARYLLGRLGLDRLSA